MKKLFIAAAIGLGSFLTSGVNAQTPAPTPAQQAIAHKTTSPTTLTRATAPHDAKGHYTKTEVAKPAVPKAGTATAKPATASQSEAKSHYVKAEAAKPATVKNSQSQPLDAKSRSVKKSTVAAPTTK